MRIRCEVPVHVRYAEAPGKGPRFGILLNLKLRRYLYNVRLARIVSSITKVLDCLLLGGRRDAEALCSISPLQIATVITLCEEPVRRRNPAIRYLHFPVRDARPIPISWLSAILIAIEESVPRGAVLVHCGAGVSRAPTVVAAYLDRIGFLRFSEALCYLENLRPAIAPSPVLVQTIARELR